MSYVPRHARTPVYKKVLRTASASVAVTAAFISTQPAMAVQDAEDKEVTTNVDTTAADSGTPAADSDSDTGTVDNTGDTGTADVNTADTTSEKDTATAEEEVHLAPEVNNNAAFGAGVADFFSTVLRAFGSITEGAASTPDKPADSAERIVVQPGETRTIDVTDKVDRSELESHKVTGIELDNAEELADLGVHASVSDTYTVELRADKDAPAGERSLDLHFTGEGATDEMKLTLGLKVEDTAPVDTEDSTTQPGNATQPDNDAQPDTAARAENKPEGDTENAGKDSEDFEVTYPAATTHQMGTTSIAPKFDTTASPVKTPEGTKFDLALTRNGKPLATAGGDTTPQWLTINSTTGAITVEPEYNTTPGEYTGEVTVTYADGSVDKAPVTFTITTSKDADKYTPQYTATGHLNPAAMQDSEMNLTVKESRPLPEGTTFALVKDEPGVSVDENGRVILHARDNAKPGRYLVKVKVTYPDGTSDVVNATYRINDKDNQAETITISDAHTTTDDALRMKRRTTAVLPALAAVAGQTLPEGTKFDTTGDFPAWAELNGDTGAIELNPSLNDHPGDYALDTLVTYPDGSQERVTRYVHVESGYSTGEWFQYKRKDGLGKKVGRALDKALGTELDHGDTTDPQATGAAPDDDFGLIGTAVKPSEAAATGTASGATGRSANAPRQAASTGTAGTTTRTERLATTGTDTQLYVTAGAVASSFALAAAGAFALRRRRDA